MKKSNRTTIKKQTIAATKTEAVAPNLQPSTCNLQPTPNNPSIHQSINPLGTTPPLQLATLQPAQPTGTVAVIEAHPVPPALSPSLSAPAPGQKHRRRRQGRIASLPKLQRDMVGRMLWNGVPYKNIVAALDDAGFAVTERNISNWATGGYLEWRLEQDAVLESRLDQDHLLDFLRRDDAPELPEVGLQAAATRLSQALLRKLARSDDPEANLDNYSRMVDLLCRLNREITASQTQRDNSRRALGKEYNPDYVKDFDQVNAIEIERDYSNPEPDSKLEKPAVPPLLPQVPTATFLAEQAAEERHEAEIERIKHHTAMLRALAGKKSANSNQPTEAAPVPAPSKSK
jgi:hypothetical protein